MGIIATTVGIVVTVYLVVLGIDTFAIYRDAKEKIHNVTVDFQNLKIDYNKKLEDYDKVSKDFAQSLLDGLDAQIGLASNTNNTSLKKELQIKRARLFYMYPMLIVSERIKLLLELGNVGEVQDILPVLKAIENENEPNVIKQIAKIVLEELKKRLGIP